VNAVSRVAVIGEGVRVQGFALAGALVFAAESPAGARDAWRSLPPDVEVAVLTPAAAAWLADALARAGSALPARDALPRRPGVLTVVMPEVTPGTPPGVMPGRSPGAAPGRSPGAAPDTAQGAPPGLTPGAEP
jgi:vacuolar-type H+-ATPase subunit F/Vma7